MPRSPYALVALLVFLCLLAFPWSLWLDTSIDLSVADLPASLAHPIGTDSLGRDQFLLLMEAMRFTLPLLWLACGCAVLLGFIGACLRLQARAKILTILDSLISTVSGFPVIILCFVVMVFFKDQGLLSLMISLTTVLLLRAYIFVVYQYLGSFQLEYWQANQVAGGSLFHRLIRYGVLGAWRGEVAGFFSQCLKLVLIVEISLSYLGFGIQEPWPSFGRLLAENIPKVFQGQWVMPLAISLCIICCSAIPRLAFSSILGSKLDQLTGKASTLN